MLSAPSAARVKNPGRAAVPTTASAPLRRKMRRVIAIASTLNTHCEPTFAETPATPGLIPSPSPALPVHPACGAPSPTPAPAAGWYRASAAKFRPPPATAPAPAQLRQDLLFRHRLAHPLARLSVCLRQMPAQNSCGPAAPPSSPTHPLSSDTPWVAAFHKAA